MTNSYLAVVRPPKIVIVASCLSAIYAWAIFCTTFYTPGLIGPNYNTPGTDYMVFHGGIATALRHDWSLLFSPAQFTDYLNHFYRGRLSFPLTYRPFLYPPSFLVILLPFAPFSFLHSYLLFQGFTALCLCAALCVGTPRRESILLAAIAFCSPAASVNVLWGQGAFLTAAILVGGTRLLARHGILAGMMFGLLSFKPQHALMVPVLLIALRAWPAVFSACGTTLLLAATSIAIFGTEPWRIWLHSARDYAANVPTWDNSVHTCAVLLGAGTFFANVMIVVSIILAALFVFRSSRQSGDRNVQLAILLAATNLAAPHTGPYDTLLLVVSCGLVLMNTSLASSPPLAWTLGLMIWLLPLLGQPLISPIARFAPLVTVILLTWLYRSLQRSGESARPGQS